MFQEMEKAISPANRLSVPVHVIERRIYLIRGRRVMLDSDLAELYQVETRALVQAVKRNIERFPEDFLFHLTTEEAETMRSQTVIASKRNIRYQPYAFTEHGVAMLSAVLKSDRAVRMSIFIVRAFVQLRELLATNKELARKVEQLESAQKQQARTQQQHAAILVSVVQDIQKLKNPPVTRAIGFITRSPRKK